jgi:hypothetical protein
MNNEGTIMPQRENRERIIFAAPCYEKKEAFNATSYGMLLITRDRMIITTIPEARDNPDIPVRKGTPPEEKRVMQRASGPSHNRESSQLESLRSRSDSYLDRDPIEILAEDKDARAILLGDITEVIIRRVRTDSRSSRWLSILFALYSLEPAGSRYNVDYQLSVITPGREYTLVTPFSLIMKQVLVDLLGNRTHEIVDEYAPLL